MTIAALFVVAVFPPAAAAAAAAAKCNQRSSARASLVLRGRQRQDRTYRLCMSARSFISASTAAIRSADEGWGRPRPKNDILSRFSGLLDGEVVLCWLEDKKLPETRSYRLGGRSVRACQLDSSKFSWPERSGAAVRCLQACPCGLACQPQIGSCDWTGQPHKIRQLFLANYGASRHYNPHVSSSYRGRQTECKL